jgi:hypothetical protein
MTMYALMNTGLHESNRINPSVALRIYEAYVLPKLLYGMGFCFCRNFTLSVTLGF